MPVRLTVCKPASSLMLRLLIGFNVGGSFTGFTVTVKLRLTMLLDAPLSSTTTVITAEPKAFGSGAKLKLPVLFRLVYVIVGVGMIVGALEEAVTTSVCISFVAPEEIPERLTTCVPA